MLAKQTGLSRNQVYTCARLFLRVMLNEFSSCNARVRVNELGLELVHQCKGQALEADGGGDTHARDASGAKALANRGAASQRSSAHELLDRV